ncbi:MAG: tetratricopeptide repeat protein [Candidatus Omnitrophica bacterium]|nr:tetratricopeptide repeat protein [Candidatus Omnitrophota bacterium]
MKKRNRKKTKEVYLYQGRLHSVKGEYREAIEEYKKALEIDPNYKPAKVNLGFISYMKGQLNKDRIASNRYMKLPKRNRKG